MKNEKSPLERASITNINEQLTMKNCNTETQKTQINFDFGSQPKVFQTIICHICHTERELGGFVFRLVGVCDECRTECEVLITRKRFERRRENR